MNPFQKPREIVEYPNDFYRLAEIFSPNISTNEILWKYSFTLDKMFTFDTQFNEPNHRKCLIGGVSCELSKTWDDELNFFDTKIPIAASDHANVVNEVEAGENI